MSSEHEALAREAYDAFSRADYATIDRIFADSYLEHADVPPGITPDRDGLKAWIGVMHTAFPDIRFELEDLVAEGDKVACRARMTGTNTGEMMGMPPTGKRIEIDAFDYVRLTSDNRVAEHWGASQEGLMMRQLGLVPEQQAIDVTTPQTTNA